MTDPRQPAYDAVFAHIGTLAAVLPADTAHRNAMIWRAVHVALDAADNARTTPVNPVASTDAADDLPQVGWYCWRCQAINTEPCRSDSVPVHVPADWADLMTEEIAKRDEEGDDEPAAVVINPATGFGLSTGATGASPSMDVQGRCPACGGATLFLGDGGYVTCRSLDCPQPDAASTLLDRDPTPDPLRDQCREAVHATSVCEIGRPVSCGGGCADAADAVLAVRDDELTRLQAALDGDPS